MNKVILNICLFFIITNISIAQKVNFKTGTPNVKNYFTEIRYKNLKGKIIIPVIINNETYNFLFDTGAPNLISKNIWEKINSKSIKSISISDANQKKEDMVLATIPSLTIGNVTFKNTSTLVFTGENNLLFNCFKIDGIIGSNLLRKSIVQIKPKEELIILTNSSKKLQLEAADKSKLTLVGNQSSPYITIHLKGENSGTEILLFDTGASGFYDLNKRHFEIFDKKNITQTLAKSNGSSSVGLFGVANKSEQYRIRVSELKINNWIFNNVISVTGDDNNSRIGSDILDYGIVTLDFKEKLFYFEGYESKVDLNEKLLGFSPTIENNKLIVGFVWDDSLKDKIQFGDEIIEINEINIQDKDICNLITEKSVFEDFDVLNITFRNAKGEKTELTLKRELHEN
jgi:predicted aspartyl protease